MAIQDNIQKWQRYPKWRKEVSDRGWKPWHLSDAPEVPWDYASDSPLADYIPLDPNAPDPDFVPAPGSPYGVPEDYKPPPEEPRPPAKKPYQPRYPDPGDFNPDDYDPDDYPWWHNPWRRERYWQPASPLLPIEGSPDPAYPVWEDQEKEGGAKRQQAAATGGRRKPKGLGGVALGRRHQTAGRRPM